MEEFPVLGFDLDHTLIRPRSPSRNAAHGTRCSGSRTPTFYAAAEKFSSGVEWEWTAPDVPQRLATLCGAAGDPPAALWIATSQRWKPGKALDAALTRVARVAEILRGLGLRVFVSVALRDAPHRYKPSPLLWTESDAARAGGALLCYCGDDDGIGGAGKGADILLARNCGVKFVPALALHSGDFYHAHGKVPADKFPSLIESARRYSSACLAQILGLYFEAAGVARCARDFEDFDADFDASKSSKSASKSVGGPRKIAFRRDAAVVLAGAPGAGKSALAAALCAAWGDAALLHDETTPSVRRQVLRRRQARPGEPFVAVLDRTHPTAAVRAAQLAEAGAPPAVLVIFTDFTLAAELNRHRCVSSRGARFVPAIAETMFARKVDFGPRTSPARDGYLGVFRVHGVVDAEKLDEKHLRFTA